MSSVDAQHSLSSDAYWGRVASAAAIATVSVAVAYLVFSAAGVDLDMETKGNQWVNTGISQLFTNPFDDVDYTDDLPTVTLALAVSQAFGLSLLGGIAGFVLRLFDRPTAWLKWAAIAVYLTLGVLVTMQGDRVGQIVGLWVLHTVVLVPTLRWVLPALGMLNITR